MKSKGKFLFLFHFLFSQQDIYEDSKDDSYLSGYRRGISLIHILPHEKFKCHSSLQGELEGGICFITGSTNANSKSPSFHRRVYKIPLPFVKRKLTILMHKVTFIDIKSLISYFSALFIPFAEGFIVLFGMKGNWHSLIQQSLA